MKKSAIIATVMLFGVLGAAAAGLAAYKVTSIRKAMAAGQHGEPPTAVEPAVARVRSWQQTADLVGTVVATRSIDVSNELAGTVKSIGFESGSIVEPGALLLTLDDTTERADLAAAEAGVRVAEAAREVTKARAALAQLELTRLRSAADASAASRVELDRAESEARRAEADSERAQAEVDLAEARVQQIRSRLEKMVLRAPFRGRAGLRNIHEGQFLAEGSSIVSLAEVGDRIHLDFAIPQEYIAQVARGTSVMAKGEAFGEEPVRIEVVAVDAAVNNSTRNVRVRAIVDNRDDRLRPGMFVQIQVPVGPPVEVLVVPATAVRRTPYADQVFVLENAEIPHMKRARQRFVRLGPAIGDEIVVREGLVEGERVASSGAFKLRDGGLVAEVTSKATGVQQVGGPKSMAPQTVGAHGGE